MLSFATDGSDAGKSFKIKLSLKNEANQELVADIVEFILAGVPGTPTQGPTQNKTESSLSVLSFTIQSLSDDGGSSLTSYEAYIFVQNEWRIMLTSSLSTSFLYRNTSGLQIGKIYMTRYRGSNINGQGGWSPISYATYGSVPTSPQTPTLIEATNSSLEVGIIPPNDDGGSLILSYRIEIQSYNDDGASVSDWQTVSSYPPAAVSNNPAQIPFSHNLTASTDGIVQSKIYRIRSYAQN